MKTLPFLTETIEEKRGFECDMFIGGDPSFTLLFDHNFYSILFFFRLGRVTYSPTPNMI